MLLKLISLFGVEKVFAQEPGPITGTGSGPLRLINPLGTDNIMVIINRVLNYLIYISVPILALMILVGGFYILSAKDDTSKVQKGKDTIKYAVIGFVVILCSKGVALIILEILG
jgi:hypothetical protein